eukprot:4925470-Lingulodinium_polyedra.AAC.1
MGDPEAAWAPPQLAEGVELGVDDPLPRTPTVFRRKEHWRLPEWGGDTEAASCNYLSAEEHAD